MSLLSMADVAVSRDETPPGRPIPAPAAAADAPGSVAGFGRMLTAQIPGEALVAYTTLLALFPDHNRAYLAGRWIVYAGALLACGGVVIGAYLARRDARPHRRGRTGTWRMLPYFPAAASMLAMAVYGLTVPGSPLQQSMDSTAFAVVSGCLAVGGGVLMSILAPFLGRGNAVPTTPAPAPPASPPPASAPTPAVSAPAASAPHVSAPDVSAPDGSAPDSAGSDGSGSVLRPVASSTGPRSDAAGRAPADLVGDSGDAIADRPA